ncbi:MAG: GNAT family N-acetyltransferase [Chloroflexi bacterium]|nr:GNAT family N-acetyltransferase [Chloroflexota bacterium]
MSDPNPIARDWINALSSNDPILYERILQPMVGIRVWNPNGLRVARPRNLVIQFLIAEWSAWNDATIELLSSAATQDRIAVEFRIQATENAAYVEHNRSAFLKLKDDQIESIDLYCPAPFPSARRKGWIAPANVSAAQVCQLFESWQNSYDVRESVPMNYAGAGGMRGWMGGSGDAHPGSNGVGQTKWSAEEADAKIQEIIDYHRQRNLGFHWMVNPFDSPSDLRERLDRHGLVLAGDQALMARVGLDNLDIPTNPDIKIELIDGRNDEAIEARLQIVGTCFNWTKEQIDARRPNFFERAKDAKARENEIGFLARLNGKPVADSRVILSTGIAYLGGASTLPEYRGQRIYSTLLRKRLEVAHERGYNVAMIHAEPMSRRVVSKYGFKEYGKAYLYGWMPVMDMQVIKSLVPDD